MKYAVVLFAVLAVASAQIVLQTGPAITAYSVASPVVAAAPAVLSAPAVVAAPAVRVAAPAVAVPAVGASYVAATRGAVHSAPLPGHIVGSTHINTAPAPGTL